MADVDQIATNAVQESIPDTQTQPVVDNGLPQTNDGAQDTNQSTLLGDDAPKDWREGLSEEISKNEIFKDVKSVEDLAKALIEAKTGGYQKPESLDKFEIDTEGIDGLDDNIFGEFKKFAYENNLNPETSRKLMDFQIQAQKIARDSIVRNGEAEIKERWGDKFNENLGYAKKIYGILPEKLQQFFNVTGMGSNADVLEVFSKLGKVVSEDSIMGGAKGGNGNVSKSPSGIPVFKYNDM